MQVKKCVQGHCFAIYVKIILCPLTSVSHVLTVLNHQVCSYEEFGLFTQGSHSQPHGPLVKNHSEKEVFTSFLIYKGKNLSSLDSKNSFTETPFGQEIYLPGNQILYIVNF